MMRSAIMLALCDTHRLLTSPHSDTFFNGTPKRVGPPATSGIVAYHQTIQAIRGDALQQTISRIFAIIMRQAFGVHNVTLMQTVDNSSELMDESERINQQLQLLVNK